MLVLGGCAQPGQAIRVASASTSHALCSGVFVSGRDADQTYQEEMQPEAGMGLIDWLLRYSVDRGRREVVTTVGGSFATRAVYREGLGCLTLHGDPPAEKAASRELLAATPAVLPDSAGPDLVAAADPRIRAAIDAAFAEPSEPPARNTKAVVVMHCGRVIGERYAAGIGPTTAWHGHSLSKGITHALIGILVRQGKLDPAAPAPVPEWAAGNPPRQDVTIDQLLRMTGGGRAWRPYSGWDDASRMWALERDMAGFAATLPAEVPPGTRWNYSDPDYQLLSRIIRDAAGGTAGDVVRLADRELFGPLGMRHATIEFDATGTPIGASHVFASARDWARFGQLYLNGGRAGGTRILPEGWTQHAATPTLDAGYGAGFWLNNRGGRNPMGFDWGMPGAPADTFFGFGYLGQYLVIVPSRQLVIVRLGVTHRRGGIAEEMGRLAGEIAAALEPASQGRP